MIDLRQVVLGNPSRLRFIIRFSNCPRIHNESVSDHSFYVALYAYYISMDLIFAKGYSSLDLGKVLSKALVHDMDECFSGDMIRMFKYSDPILKMEVNKACETFMSMLSSDIAESYVRDSIYADWFESKNEREGSIVAFADYLSVLSYIHQEIDLGNHRMERQVPELKKFHGYFREEKFEFLKEYIDTAGEILNEIDECIKERKNGSRKV